MTLLFADVIQLLSQFIWPLIRISAFLIAGPFFSLAAVNLRVRLALVLILTWLIYPLVEIPEIDAFSFAALAGVFHEVMVELWD